MSADERLREYLKRVTVDLHDARRRLHEVELQGSEPVAIVGMACRYPGGIGSPRQLWELVEREEDAISRFPRNRGWDLERLYHPDPVHPGTTHISHGGFLHDIADFDAAFFDISPREATAMDPKQRLLLEAAWEALEDGNIDPLSLAGSDTGVFTGTSDYDYSALVMGAKSNDLESHIGTGTSLSVASGRLAYSLGFEGPALTVDTACSSSLVALHLACGALRSGECSLALAGGAAAMSTPSVLVASSRLGALAADGRCKSFAEAADGTGWSEGAGLLALERLSDAQRNGHRVLAVVRASAVNQDGASNGLTAPNGPSQQRVIRRALANAGLSTEDVDLVEAHGTGTPLGDPIEAQALIATYGADRDRDRPLWLGSIKSNIGHASAAAGVAGVIKVVMAMRAQVLPKTLHAERPSGNVDWSAGGVSLLREPRDWDARGRPRRAGVSSFGMSGTNAHVIVEQAPSLEEVAGARRLDVPASAANAPAGEDTAEQIEGLDAIELGPGVLGRGITPWIVSARGTSALRDQARRLCAHVESDERLTADEVAGALAGRAQLAHRALVVGVTREELLGGFEALAGGAAAANLLEGRAGRPGSVFVFPGVGSQWAGMASALMDCSPPFRERMRECEQALEPHVEWRLEHVLQASDGAPSLQRNDVLQPVLFAMMVSLARLWEACGVRPSAVIGHSQGEIAAACVAGGLSLQDAMRVVALRSRIQLAMIGQGALISVGASQADVQALLERCEQRVAIAAVNSPSSVVVSGAKKDLSELVELLEAEGISTRTIKEGNAASHSPHVEPLRDELLEALAAVAPLAGSVPFFSTVTGAVLDTRELGAEYWYRNMREPVQFEGAVRGLLRGGHRTFIEISAHPVLAAVMQQTIESLSDETEESSQEPACVLGSLRRDQGGPARFLTSLGEAWVRGAGVDWKAVIGRAPSPAVDLPTYAFQRERYWPEPGSPAGASSSDAAGNALDRAGPSIGESSGTEHAPEGGAPEDRDYVGPSALAAQLAPLDESERKRLALELVRSQVAAVLGHAAADQVDPRKPFKELGFDSVMAVELRNKLQSISELSLPSTLAFSNPTPLVLADFLIEQALGDGPESAPLARTALNAEEPIAIVGMSCRFPGGVGSPEEFWKLLVAGRDAIGEFPEDRGWDLERLYHPDPDHHGTSYVREAGFLDDIVGFDASFFGISPREAVAMDPQQRLLLELSWETFDDAGLDPVALHGSQTGAYVGLAGQDYATALYGPGSQDTEGFRMSGGMSSMASGRIAYALGLEGPAVSVDTACSSSLVAMHLACQALRAGECSLALAGGATVMSSPLAFIEMARQRALSADGRCKAFAEEADGTGFSEGAGMVLLERLSDARRHGHRVLALLRGSAINQDGASYGLTAPNGRAQERVIRQALANAGVSPEEVDVVEAHGTGTMLGDPIEAHALLGTYGQGRPMESPLWLGSVKSNIGHTSAAAGVAGVIKMVLALRNELLPRTLHAEQPSRQVQWSAGAVSLLSDARTWQPNGRPRRAGISSFGASGTNAHLIVEEASSQIGSGTPQGSPATVEPQSSEQAATLAESQLEVRGTPAGLLGGDVVPWLVSGRGERALRGQAGRLLRYLGDRPEPAERDVGFSLACRTAFEDRAVVLGDSRERLLRGLAALAEGSAEDELVQGSGRRNGGRIAFVFPGQGSQWQGMALELLDCSVVFSDRIEACADALTPFVEWSLTDVLRGARGSPGLERVDVVQPVLFAVMVALAGLWRASGVHPSAVVGHSQGEIAAVHVAGGLSLSDAARVVALRSAALRRLEGLGGMVSVSIDEKELDWLLSRFGERVCVAAVNSPRSLVLAGDVEALAELLAHCAAEGVRARRIDVSYAAHSPQIDAVREELLEGLAPIVPCPSEVPLYSTVTGEAIDTALLNAEYWYRNLREPVRLQSTVRALLNDGARTFVEISPHPVLTMAVGETVDALISDGADAPGSDGIGTAVRDPGEVALIGSLRRGLDGPRCFVRSLAEAWTAGVDVAWDRLYDSGAKRVTLPPYAFQRERYWVAPISGADDLASLWASAAANPWLGSHAGAAGERAGLAPDRGLSRRLAGAAPERREAIVLEVLLAEAASVLGHTASETLDAEHSFLELGMTSLMALELRSRISSATHLSLPNALALDYPTPAALAAYVAARLTEQNGAAHEDERPPEGGAAHTAAEQVELSTQAMTDPLEGPSEGMLTALFRQAHELGKIGEFTGLLMATARFRPTFDLAAKANRVPDPVRLCSGTASPALVCFPSTIALAGPHEYARFARALDGRHELSVVSAPGYGAGELLPASFDALVQMQADAVRRLVGAGPCALVGYSSGGIVAHAVASLLEDEGTPSQAVVLIDTYPFDSKELLGVTGVAFEKEEAYRFLNDARLTAMGAYLGLLDGWEPSEIATPMLLVRASEPVPGIPTQEKWRVKWNVPHAEVDVPGHHFTVMEDHASETALAVQEWLSTLFTEERVMGGD
jgi:acyl transferase domain-containing protein